MKEDANGNKTYYVRDAGGTLLSVYTATGIQTPQQQEVMLYGSGRLGMAYKNGNNYEYMYEVKDHLGTVRGVFTADMGNTTVSTKTFKFDGTDVIQWNPEEGDIVTNMYRSVPSSYAVNDDYDRKDISIKKGTVTAEVWYLILTTDDDEASKAELSIGTERVDGQVRGEWTKLEMTRIVSFSGDVSIRLASSDNDYVYFDDLKITISSSQPTLVATDVADYYPFGLRMRGNLNSYRFGYQSLSRFCIGREYAEDETEETGWNSFEARMYDPVIGRWLSVDPARQFASPYLGMGNNPVSGVDPDGRF
ncbi:MAG: RHS repeat-associated core domain-containing protein [Cyclobacteriaceae bacterium]